MERLPQSYSDVDAAIGDQLLRLSPDDADAASTPHDGVGGHWWYRLTAEDCFDNQLPEVVGGARKPANW